MNNNKTRKIKKCDYTVFLLYCLNICVVCGLKELNDDSLQVSKHDLEYSYVKALNCVQTALHLGSIT